MPATLNVTYQGVSRDVAQIEPDTPVSDVQRIAAECLEVGPSTFLLFVVDRFPDTGMVYLRPKVPFG